MGQSYEVRRSWGMRLGALVGAMIVVAGGLAPGADAARPAPCTDRVLVLSAFPAELDAVLSRSQFRKRDEVVAKGRSFFPGVLGGKPVVMAMTGIGPANARITTELALKRFSCPSGEGITAVVFSGVAGSTYRIGDVVVPERWTNDGVSWTAADPAMLAVAQSVAADPPPLEQSIDFLGRPVCCERIPEAARLVRLAHQPEIFVGGDGVTTDPFGGRVFPCIPGGGDVFGCRACESGFKAPDIARFLRQFGPFLDPDFFLSYITDPPPNAASTEAIDNESAPVAEVAAAHGLPFIAFRGVSDGEGDPLSLPGFPVQFFAYRIISAENAAAAATAFLERW